MIGSGARDSRQRWFINPADQVLVWNAILLQSLFGAPKIARRRDLTTRHLIKRVKIV